MPFDSQRIRQLLQNFEFKALFIEELGWDNYTSRPLRVTADQQEFTLSPLAEKRGMAVFVCGPDNKGKVPNNAIRRKIERQISKSIHEHIIIYADADQSTQIWQWVKRETGKPLACREHSFHKSQTGDALVQKLSHLMVALSEEEELTITEVTGRSRKAFDVDKVTKRFYDRFKEEHKIFRKILKRIDAHPNHRYFILKSIIINNLYGVDVMEEATEICKLRLFLKLMPQVERVEDIEPLPDIDFNIRAGNTLVGYATSGEVDHAVTFGQFDFANNRARIEEKAEEADRAFQLFHEMQTDQAMAAKDFTRARETLRERLSELEEELNRYLAKDYNVNPDKKNAYEKWLKSHQPFHWFIEFYGIIKKGGFDVIIGNPPYLERSKLGGIYSIRGCKTEKCRDIYSWVVERAFCLRHSAGKLGLIIPISIASSGSFDILRDVVSENSTMLWLSNFANRPGQLFIGAQNRLTIILSSGAITVGESFSTQYHRWDARNGERKALFSTIQYVALGNLERGFKRLYPKVGGSKGISILQKIGSARLLGTFLPKHSKYLIYWVRVPGYFCQFFLDPPKVRPENGGPARYRGELNNIFAPEDSTQRVIHALLNSSAYFQFFCAYTDGRHINPSDVNDLPFNLDNIGQSNMKALVALSKELEAAMKKNMSEWRKSGLLIESVDSCPTKPIIDEIDRVLAKHYGFTDEELDFIINYDVKYRMGLSGQGK